MAQNQNEPESEPESEPEPEPEPEPELEPEPEPEPESQVSSLSSLSSLSPPESSPLKFKETKPNVAVVQEQGHRHTDQDAQHDLSTNAKLDPKEADHTGAHQHRPNITSQIKVEEPVQRKSLRIKHVSKQALENAELPSSQHSPLSPILDLKSNPNPKPLPPTTSNTDRTKIQPDRGTKRKRAAATNGNITTLNFDPPYTPATADEKASWGGFCEIESDPAIFTNLLHNFGVNCVRIQEIFSLDSDMLAFLPKPVYGIIFLFQYASDVDAGDQKEECPSHIWFANQIVPNCCATVALLNMVNNIPDIDLGPQMQQLRYFSMPFSPAFRGELVANSSFIKKAHNAYARKIDMLNLDACLEEEISKSRKKGSRKSSNAKKSKAVQEDSAFHFVAYMPIDNEIWRLDGLDAYPQRFGSVGSTNWLDEVAPVLSARMADYAESGIQFSLLALVKDPVGEKKAALLRNVSLLVAAEDKLQTLDASWRSFTETSSASIASIASISASFGISEDDLARHHLSDADTARLAKFDDLTSLLDFRRKLADEQGPLRGEVMDCVRSAQDDEAKAVDRQNDYVPFLQAWMGMLAENGELKSLVESVCI
jgi:ubiquitin carboxyl-terminal hydrolase L5